MDLSLSIHSSSVFFGKAGDLHRIFRGKRFLLLSPAALFLSLVGAVPLSARTWTDAASGRTLEGDYNGSDATQVFIKSGARLIKIDIARLSEADQAFVRAQSAKAGLTAKVESPVSVKSLAVTGTGKDREGGLEVTNHGDKAITRLVLNMILLGEDGRVKNTVPHTSDGFFGKRGSELRPGQPYVIKVSDFWIKDDITDVVGMPTRVTWEDGTGWPTWTGPAPKQDGDSPVSMVMKGFLGEGIRSAPLIECFNHSSRDVTRMRYRITYFDAAGEEMGKGGRMGISGIKAGQGIAFIGAGRIPDGAVDFKLSVAEVTFGDDPGVAVYSALTAEQTSGRKDVSGGNWLVSFEEDRYLGFVVAETSKNGKKVIKYHWSSEPARQHRFHFDHFDRGDNHELRFSSAGKSPGVEITRRFSDPEFGHSQSLVEGDLELRPASSRLSKSLRGPFTLYSLRSIVSDPTFTLNVVAAKDTAKAEESLNRYYKK